MSYKIKFGKPQVPGFQPDGSYQPNEYYMGLAIEWGSECVERGQHPVGAVVTRIMDAPTDQGPGKQPILKTYEFVAGIGANNVENNSTQHAETVALHQAEMYQGRRNLAALQSVLYTTHEPCPMCAGFVANSKISGVVYGTSAQDALDLAQNEGIRWRSNSVSGLDIIRGRIEAGMPEQFIIGGFMRDECLDLLRTAGRLSVA